MTQKIKLMSEQDMVKLFSLSNSFSDEEVMGARKIGMIVVDECEKRATEKMREACKWFYMNITQTATSLRYLSDSANNHFELMFQQFLKEQENEKAISLLNEWKERDGSEIDKTYEDLTKELKKEQDGT